MATSSSEISNIAYWTDLKHIGILAGICLLFLGGSFLLWWMGHLIHNLGSKKTYGCHSAKCTKTWHGWVDRRKHERNIEKRKRYKEKFKDLFQRTATIADSEWIFWDPTGFKRREYELKREETLLRFLPRWMRSWEPQFLASDRIRDVEKDADSASMFRSELPPRYSETEQSAQIFCQIDGAGSCNGPTLDYPFMTGALPESCDCAIVPTVRRRKNSRDSPSAWHAASDETSRAIYTQLLIPRNGTRLSVTKSEAETPSTTDMSNRDRVVQRATSVPSQKYLRRVNRAQLRASLSVSTGSVGRVQFVLREIDPNRGPKSVREGPHNTEMSSLHDCTKPSIAPEIETLEQSSEPIITTQSPTILEYYSRLNRAETGAHKSAICQVVAGNLLEDPNSQGEDHKGKVPVTASNCIYEGSSASSPDAAGTTRSQDSDNIPLPKMEDLRRVSQPNMSQQSCRVRSLHGSNVMDLPQIDEVQRVKDAQVSGRTLAEKHRVKEKARPKVRKFHALTDNAIHNLQPMLWPHRNTVIDSQIVYTELQSGGEENIPTRISPAPRQASQQQILRSRKRRLPLKQHSENAHPIGECPEKSLVSVPNIPPARSLTTRLMGTISRSASSKISLSASDKALAGKVSQRLGWLGDELLPGHRKDLQKFPFVWSVTDPQPVSLCGTPLKRSQWRSQPGTKSQARYNRPMAELETEQVQPGTSMTTAAWLARHSPNSPLREFSPAELDNYCAGGEIIGTLRDWQELKDERKPVSPHKMTEEDQYRWHPKQLVIPKMPKDHIRYDTYPKELVEPKVLNDHGEPSVLKRTISRSASLSGVAAKRLRRVGKLTVRHHRPTTSNNTQMPHAISGFGGIQTTAINEIACEEVDKRVFGVPKPAKQVESIDTAVEGFGHQEDDVSAGITEPAEQAESITTAVEDLGWQGDDLRVARTSRPAEQSQSSTQDIKDFGREEEETRIAVEDLGREEEEDVRAIRMSVRAERTESTTISTPQDGEVPSDNSILQEIEKTSATSTLLGGMNTPDVFRDVPLNHIVRDVKLATAIIDAQAGRKPCTAHACGNSTHPNISSPIREGKQPIRDSAYRYTEDRFKDDMEDDVDHPFHMFHRSYREASGFRGVVSQLVG